MLFDQPWIGRPLPQERGIRFGDEKDANPMAQSMLLAYRLTGIALIEDALTPRKGWLGAAVRL